MNDLIPLLSELTGMGTEWLWAGLVVFLRVGAAMALLPAFGEQSVPQRVRLILALAFAAVVTPAVFDRVSQVWENVLLTLGSEVIVGLAIGIGLRLFVMALQIAGAIIAQATSLSQMFGGAGPEPQPAIGNLLVMAGLALAVMSGLHVKAAQLFILSYDIFPAGDIPQPADMADWGLFQISRAFSLGFSLAAPFVIAALIYNVALGVINRAMPQLMVSMIGAPALTLGALVLMAIVVPLALGLWLNRFNGFLGNPFGIAP